MSCRARPRRAMCWRFVERWKPYPLCERPSKVRVAAKRHSRFPHCFRNSIPVTMCRALIARSINDDAPTLVQRRSRDPPRLFRRAGWHSDRRSARDMDSRPSKEPSASEPAASIAGGGLQQGVRLYLEITHANAEATRKITSASKRSSMPSVTSRRELERIRNPHPQCRGAHRPELEEPLFTEVSSGLPRGAECTPGKPRQSRRLTWPWRWRKFAVGDRYVRPGCGCRRSAASSGRHPVVEQVLSDVAFVPNDLHFDANERILVITGPT